MERVAVGWDIALAEVGMADMVEVVVDRRVEVVGPVFDLVEQRVVEEGPVLMSRAATVQAVSRAQDSRIDLPILVRSDARARREVSSLLQSPSVRIVPPASLVCSPRPSLPSFCSRSTQRPELLVLRSCFLFRKHL